MSAIAGTKRTAKQLVDGTIAVTIHVEPRDAAQFWQMFPSVDTPCAIAPLVNDFERLEQKEEEPKGGDLCRLAAMWCKEEDFRLWLAVRMNLGGAGMVPRITEDEAAQHLREFLEIESRRELDNDPDAAARFHTQVRLPFMQWRRAGQRER